jgi:hypothetical protein
MGGLSKQELYRITRAPRAAVARDDNTACLRRFRGISEVLNFKPVVSKIILLFRVLNKF